MLMYELKELPVNPSINSQYVTREEFEEVINQLRGVATPPPAPQPPAAKEEFRF